MFAIPPSSGSSPSQTPQPPSSETEQPKEGAQPVPAKPDVYTTGTDLDKLLSAGGIPVGSVVLVEGNAGAGKSTLVKQIVANALKRGERVLYVTSEEPPSFIRKELRERFGAGDEDLQRLTILQFTADCRCLSWGQDEQGRKVCVQRDPYCVEAFQNGSGFQLIHRINAMSWEAKRQGQPFDLIVVDSVSTMWAGVPSLARKLTGILYQKLRALRPGMAVLTAQVASDEAGPYGGAGIEHEVDGIIKMFVKEADGKLVRGIMIWKMRGTKHSHYKHPYEITDRGIAVRTDQYLDWRWKAKAIEGG